MWTDCVRATSVLEKPSRTQTSVDCVHEMNTLHYSNIVIYITKISYKLYLHNIQPVHRFAQDLNSTNAQ